MAHGAWRHATCDMEPHHIDMDMGMDIMDPTWTEHRGRRPRLRLCEHL
jgi:hypothetical protein